MPRVATDDSTIMAAFRWGEDAHLSPSLSSPLASASTNCFGRPGEICQGRGDHGLDVLEIVSPVHLRAGLGLVDGDDVVVEVPPPPESKS